LGARPCRYVRAFAFMPLFVKRLMTKNTLQRFAVFIPKRTFVFLLLPFYFSLSTLSAQDRQAIDSLKNQLNLFDANEKELGRHTTPLADTVKEEILYQIAIAYWGTIPDTAIYYAQQILTLSKQLGYKKGIGNYYNALGLSYMALKNYTEALGYYQQALKIRTEIGDKAGMAWTWNDLGMMRGNQGDYEDAIKCHLQSLEIKKETGDREGMAGSFGKIGHDYYSMGKFPEAVNNYLEALKIEEEDSNKARIGGFYEVIGDIYYNEGNYPEASKNFRNELKIAGQTGNKYQAAATDLNMGKIYYKLGNDTGAIRFLDASLRKYEELNLAIGVASVHYNSGLVFLDMGNFVAALSNARLALEEYQTVGSPFGESETYIETGSIYEKQGKFQDALESVTKGLSIARQIGARVEIKDAFKSLSDINAGMHNYEAAYRENKEYSNAVDSLSSNESANKISTLAMNYAFKKREDSAQAEQDKQNIIKTAESKQKSLVTEGAVVISILTILLAMVVLNRQQLKRKKDAVIFEKEKQRIENELASAKTILDEYIQNMEEKNKLLEEFKTDVEGFKNIYDKERIEKLEYLNKATILTDEDWNKFKQLFEQVHKDFFKRLKEKLPDLTQSEIRLVSLTKLEIGTKQMAGILGVSFDTIKVSRHRLRKKLGLSEENTLENIANSI
jgi:tetratricopeptide (TPR) repeat protein